MGIRAALKEGMAQLRAAQIPSHTLATELLLMHALGRDRAWIYSHPEESLDAATAEKFLALIARRAAGEPVQYLTGKQEFWGLEFEVTPAVLIPRPETEHVMEVALARLGERGIKIHMDTGAPRETLRVARRRHRLRLSGRRTGMGIAARGGVRHRYFGAGARGGEPQRCAPRSR